MTNAKVNVELRQLSGARPPSAGPIHVESGAGIPANPPRTPSTPLGAALVMAGLSYPSGPVYPDGSFGTGWDAATADPDQLEADDSWPRAMGCGVHLPRAELIVIDADGPGGEAEMMRLCGVADRAELAALTFTTISKKGPHAWFLRPECLADSKASWVYDPKRPAESLAPELDTVCGIGRALDHKKRWLSSPERIAPCPPKMGAALAEMVEAQRKREADEAAEAQRERERSEADWSHYQAEHANAAERGDAYAAASLDGIVADAGAISEGRRNIEGNGANFKAGTIAGAEWNGLGEDAAVAAMMVAHQRNGLAEEMGLARCERWTRRGVRAGMAHPAAPPADRESASLVGPSDKWGERKRARDDALDALSAPFPVFLTALSREYGRAGVNSPAGRAVRSDARRKDTLVIGAMLSIQARAWHKPEVSISDAQLAETCGVSESSLRWRTVYRKTEDGRKVAERRPGCIGRIAATRWLDVTRAPDATTIYRLNIERILHDLSNIGKSGGVEAEPADSGAGVADTEAGRSWYATMAAAFSDNAKPLAQGLALPVARGDEPPAIVPLKQGRDKDGKPCLRVMGCGREPGALIAWLRSKGEANAKMISAAFKCSTRTATNWMNALAAWGVVSLERRADGRGRPALFAVFSSDAAPDVDVLEMVAVDAPGAERTAEPDRAVEPLPAELRNRRLAYAEQRGRTRAKSRLAQRQQKREAYAMALKVAASEGVGVREALAVAYSKLREGLALRLEYPEKGRSDVARAEFRAGMTEVSRRRARLYRMREAAQQAVMAGAESIHGVLEAMTDLANGAELEPPPWAVAPVPLCGA